MSSRKRRAPSGWDWTKDDTSGGIEDVPQTTFIRHTNFDLEMTGGSSSRTQFIATPASPEKRPGVGTAHMSYDDDDDDMPALGDALPDSDDEDEGDTETETMDPEYQRHLNQLEDSDAPRISRKRTPADNPTVKWLPERDDFLLQMLRLDGRGDWMHETECPHCDQRSQPVMRCKDCHGGGMLCAAKSILFHLLPNLTKQVQRWNGSHFERTTLKDLGLQIQLGHGAGERCVNPMRAAGDDFVIIDCNGVHAVALDYCGCTSANKETIQLLRARLYPASAQAPKTAATFNVLEFFHLLTFDSKASVFEFYHTLTRRTDNTGTFYTPDRYDELLRIMRQWRNLKMCKRAGRGHDPEGIAATKEGDCAVLCPACPQPGKNLPPDWQNAPDNIQFIFELLLAADANFRMVRRKVSSEAADPTLSPGFSYFVEMSKYREHLAKYGDQKETHSTCVKHHAVGDANTSRFANLAASGIGTIDCTRHMMKRANSVGELQKGERYANMDYIFFSSVSQQEFVRLVMSYDIVCQWFVHLWKRMLDMPGYLKIDREGKEFIFLIPKFHLPAHVERCHTSFSFNLTRGVGRTDGEAPERGWSNINPLSASAKQMGPASFRETIDDHFGDWNHQRIVGLGRLLRRKIKDAVEARDEHIEEFYAFSDTIVATSVIEWTSMVEAWETDNTQSNPFVPTIRRTTQNDVRLSLAQLDAEDLQQENAAPVHEEITPGIFIASGLDLEAQQVRLKANAKALDASATSLQLSKIQERKNALSRKIKTWTDTQQLYMPEVTIIRAREHQAVADGTKETHVYDIPLHFPSALPHRTPTNTKLVEYEFRLRYAQADEALEELRQQLRLRSHMWFFKDKNIRGQSSNTHSRNLLNRVQKKIDASAVRYTCARAAVASLAQRTGTVGWDSQLRELKPQDIRAFTDETEDQEAERKKKNKKKQKHLKGLGEGKKMLSWIWVSSGVAGDGSDKGLQEALRIQWCRSRARAMRWSEEVLLVREEMRRVLTFFRWHADWWTEQAEHRSNLSPEDREGISAYANKQASICRSMAGCFDRIWRAGWADISEGAGSDNELLDLGPNSTSFITDYPASPSSV
ncbi:hypothetical protein FIBSPDRAFT_952228 [Athelia psychrophila]|uniref:CxC2-like cysteine cluster KDZ transposase-associated domain-containing protein n=1 Tax=Athelia psychrophila TaxID=1759441 RepID=A0A166LNN8_9AGAM|nr:hypothetical protein FIBSPDRAFT_952228 [Fibularhizoctonia sp. CBS 109695]